MEFKGEEGVIEGDVAWVAKKNISIAVCMIFLIG